MSDRPISFSPLSETPLVSCVIIFYNNQHFLAEAIESVLNQTYEHWELLLMDDGSTDGSTQIAQQCAQALAQKVHYLEHPHHQNRGKNASRNLGIQRAKGELIALLDGDDVWLPDKLAEQVAVYQQHPEAGMVYGHTQSWYSWSNNPEEKDRFSKLGVSPNTLVQPPKLALDLLEGLNQTPTTCNVIMRREVFDKIGYFDQNYHDVFEDQAFFIKVELNFPVFVADNFWARYRKHSGSCFVQFKTAAQHDMSYQYRIRLQFLDWIETYLKNQDYQNPDVWKDLSARQNRLRKQLQLQRFLTYRLWRQALEAVMRLGRQTLPQSWRDWLWQSVGKRFYAG